MSFKLPLRGLYLFSVKKVSTEFALHEHTQQQQLRDLYSSPLLLYL